MEQCRKLLNTSWFLHYLGLLSPIASLLLVTPPFLTPLFTQHARYASYYSNRNVCKSQLQTLPVASHFRTNSPRRGQVFSGASSNVEGVNRNSFDHRRKITWNTRDGQILIGTLRGIPAYKITIKDNNAHWHNNAHAVHLLTHTLYLHRLAGSAYATDVRKCMQFDTATVWFSVVIQHWKMICFQVIRKLTTVVVFHH